MILKQTIAIALKSGKAANYIEQLMTLDEETQECLGAIVEECLAAIDDGNSGGRSSTQSDRDQLSRSLDSGSNVFTDHFAPKESQFHSRVTISDRSIDISLLKPF